MFTQMQQLLAIKHNESQLYNKERRIWLADSAMGFRIQLHVLKIDICEKDLFKKISQIGQQKESYCKCKYAGSVAIGSG